MLELFHPGTIVPGVVGGICLLVAAIAFQMLPVNIGALLLVALASGSSSRRCTWAGTWVRRGRPGLRGDRLAAPGRHVDKSFYADATSAGLADRRPVGARDGGDRGTLAWKLSASARQPLRAGGYR